MEQNVEKAIFVYKQECYLKSNQALSCSKKHGSTNKQAPLRGGESQTAQGERSVTLGISSLNSHNDSLRVDGVSLETDGIVEAMTYPETSLHWRICHSVPERKIRQCRS